MIPITQTIQHDPDNNINGNCFSAVLASLLHIPIEDIPVFSSEESWLCQVNHFLQKYNLCYIQVNGLKEVIRDTCITGMYHEIGGTTNRADCLHAVVGLDGDQFFDPHPSRLGLKEEVNYGVFIVLDPSKMSIGVI